MKIEARFDHAIVPVGAPAIIHVLLTLTAPKAASNILRPKLNIAADYGTLRASRERRGKGPL